MSRVSSLIDITMARTRVTPRMETSPAVRDSSGGPGPRGKQLFLTSPGKTNDDDDSELESSDSPEEEEEDDDDDSESESSDSPGKTLPERCEDEDDDDDDGDDSVLESSDASIGRGRGKQLRIPKFLAKKTENPNLDDSEESEREKSSDFDSDSDSRVRALGGKGSGKKMENHQLKSDRSKEAESSSDLSESSESSESSVENEKQKRGRKRTKSDNNNDDDDYNDDNPEAGKKRAKNDNDIDSDRTHMQHNYRHFQQKIPAVILPCLLLHDRGNLAVIQCKWNMRSVDSTRLTGIDGLVAKLSQENSEAGPSTLVGDKSLCAVTSFSVGLDGKVEQLPVTLEIVQAAILWTTGKPAIDCDDIVELIVKFLQSLEEIPGDVQHLKRYIAQHTWCASSNGTLAELQNLPEEDESSKAKLLQFIEVNLAWNTKILANPLGCQHRAHALSTVLGKTDDIETCKRISYYSTTTLLMRCLVVTEELFLGGLDTAMQSFSALSQHTSGKHESYGLREFLLMLMKCLDVALGVDDGCYLCTTEFDIVLQRYHGRNFTKQVTLEDAKRDVKRSGCDPSIEIPDNLKPYKIPFFYVQCWIEKMSKRIQEVMEENPAVISFLKENGVDWSDVKSKWIWLFQPKTKGKGEGEYKYLCGNYNYTLHYFMKGGDIYCPKRYPGGNPALVVEIVQLLLWSRLSPHTYETMLKLFNSPCEAHVTKVQVFRQISCWFHSITAAVYYSSEVWEQAILALGKRTQTLILEKQVMFFFLLMSAIKHNTPFYAEWGLNSPIAPCHKKVLERLNTTLNTKNLFSPFQDEISFATVFHVCHMHMHARKISTTQGLGLGLDTTYLSDKRTLAKLRNSISIITRDSRGAKESPFTASTPEYLEDFFLDTKDVAHEIEQNCTVVISNRKSTEDDEIPADGDESDVDLENNGGNELAFPRTAAGENEGGGGEEPDDTTTTSFDVEVNLLSALEEFARFVRSNGRLLSSLNRTHVQHLQMQLDTAIRSIQNDNIPDGDVHPFAALSTHDDNVNPIAPLSTPPNGIEFDLI